MDFKGMFTDLKDTTSKFDKKDIENGKLMSVISYLGILCLIPYFTEKENKYVRYHAIQGLNLFLISTIYSIAYSIVSCILVLMPIVGWFLLLPLGLISFGFVGLTILGIVYVLQDKAKEIPVINKIQIVKE